jgi:Leucine-rich repeat (LRR) protein
LADSLKINKSLEKLYLEFNNISEVGANILLKALDNDSINLVKLDLEYNDTTDEVNKEIYRKLKSKERKIE